MIGRGTRCGLWPAVAVVLFALVVGCSSSGGGSEDAAVDAAGDAMADAGTDLAPDAAPLTHDEMLNKLGITTALGGPLGPDGKPLPKDYNPLARPRTTFMPKMELFLAGFSRNGAAAPCVGTHQCLYDDKDGSYAPLHATTDDSWTSAAFKNVIGADFDGDGRDEIAVVYYADATKKLKLKVIDRDAGMYKETDAEIASGVEEPVVALYKTFHPTLAAGDLDGDGRDELAVGFDKLYVVDDKDASFAVTSKDYTGYMELFVAAGDVDGDGQDELAVTYHDGTTHYAYLDLFDGDLSATALRSKHLLHDASNGHTYAGSVHVAIGDIDGDGLGELVFHGVSRVFAEPTEVLAAMDDAKSSLAWLDLFFCTFQNASSPPPFQPTLQLLDYDGDMVQEIFASAWIFDYKKGATLTSYCGAGVDLEGVLVATEPPFSVAAGDVDGDLKDELIYYFSGGLGIGGQDSTGNWAVQEIWTGGGGLDSQVCTANVDDDSPTVEYVGRELQLGDPQVIAVMAAPPLHLGIGQNEGASGTSFGKSTATGVEQSKSMGFSVGFSIGFEAEAPFGLAKASFKTTVESSMDATSSQSTEVEQYVSYAGGAGEDKVIFTAVPFDVYYYKILSSPVASEVGKMLTINMPRQMQTLSVERGFYNAYNGDGDDIDSSVLKHTIGDPRSYPTEAERDALLKSGGLMSVASPVGVGSGSITVGIRKSAGQGTGSSFDFGVTMEGEAGVVGVTMGGSAGFHYGYESSVTHTESTLFEGTVGDIPQSAYDSSRAYSFGLFAYPFTRGDQKFTVVNYWVK